jgi:P27 family predicted phage terminase small subunit
VGERGPTPIPHARRRNKRVNTGKVIPVAAPEMASDMEGEAAAEWARVVPEIESMGLLTTLDRGALIRYCRAWADWCDLDEKLRATGLLVKGARDGLVRNPLWMMRSDIENTLRELGKQIGLTPAARLRAGVKHEEPEVDESQVRITAIEEYRKRMDA